MSETKIKAALETKLKEQDPDFATAWENLDFTPSPGVPHQEAWVLFAKPVSYGFGDEFTRFLGYLQVTVSYPTNQGAGYALERAEALANWFKRGLSMVNGGVTTIVEERPEIGAGRVDGDRYKINVFVRFFANVAN